MSEAQRSGLEPLQTTYDWDREERLSKNERDFSIVTVIAHFEEPGIQQALKGILKKQEYS